eukprot:2621811-Alexandrium_andersonii.AAC.1
MCIRDSICPAPFGLPARERNYLPTAAASSLLAASPEAFCVKALALNGAISGRDEVGRTSQA